MGNPQVEKNIVVSATFTAEPLQPGLEFWMKRMESPVTIEFAPYNQVFQELLNPDSLSRRNNSGMNVLMVKFDDWLRYVEADGIGDREAEHMLKTFADFTEALETFSTQSSTFTLLVLCPSSADYSGCERFSNLALDFEKELESFFQSRSKSGNMGWIKAESVHRQFSVEEFFDPFADQMGHVPYTTGYFNVLSTIVARWYYSLLHPPYKVIVLDCDNTLWAGVCGEDGPTGVRVEGMFRKFQEFLVEKASRGFLLCLCSKNNEEDVWNTFEQNPGMILKREHIVDYRINWNPKSENIRSMARSLNLGLDSFLFFDDNPVEMAEVRARCPEVLCLQWPLSETDDSFLHHIWMLDKFAVTSEDKSRAESYKANVKRDKLLRSSSGFSDFIDSLGLEATIESMPPEALPRVSQLTNRTNQFNFTTIRRTATEIQALLDAGTHECLIARVKDRFGDYGIVGVMIVKVERRALHLDTFLLSCRVLGRGVEYKMMAHLGQMAVDKGARKVGIIYKKSIKNEPARLFIEKITPSHITGADDEGMDITFPAGELAAVQFQPSQSRQEKEVSSGEKKASPKQPAPFDVVRKREEFLAEMATQLCSLRQLELQVRAFSQPDIPLAAVGDGVGFEDIVLDKVVAAFSQALGIPPAELGIEDEIDRYIQRNSLKVVEITSLLHKEFNSIPTTLLFERRTIKDIASGIVEMERRGGVIVREKELDGVLEGRSIAIIGMNGRFPGAESIEEFWGKLKDGVNCVTEVPPERWDADAHFAPGDVPGKSYCKWGGFLSDAHRFEASFFHISPREAEMMDPQQRLFLEVVWGLLEDAGYTPASISRKTGVFVGVIASDYNTISSGAALRGDCPYRSSDYYQIPNRISYFFDFRGPSIAVDTACSASGAAIYLACQSMRQGDCDTAIAGGVNVFLHPSRFAQYSRMKILSPQGVCKPFGKGADGTVMGEGIAAVLLKSLSKAEQDGDHIYAVIKGGAINSGGKTNGFTVPNPMAQADLVEAALRDAGVEPSSLSYIETHGTGTSLGDPIEWRGLSEAFSRFSGGKALNESLQRCAIGSAKSNIGHLESAAAVAGLIKVLLQMKHRMLVPSLNAEHPNPGIDFDASPFYVQQSLEEWLPPKASNDKSTPLRAGVSSFGAGGVNVHFIVEEYTGAPNEAASSDERHIVVLSSVTAERLTAAARELMEFLSPEDIQRRINLGDLAYTLQVGRQAMNERLAVVATSIEECRELLGQFVSNQSAGRGLFRGNANEGGLHADLLLEGREGAEYLQIMVQDRKFEKLAKLWVSGATIDWMTLYKDERRRRVPLPVFRFMGERYWIPGEGSETAVSRSAANGGAALHPLLDDNVSTFMEQCFRKRLSSDDFTIRDHVLDSRMVLPGVAYLEMARVAGSLSNQAKPVGVIKHIVWTKPVILDETSRDVFVGLRPKKTSANGFDVEGWAYTVGADGKRIDHARWSMGFAASGSLENQEERLDVEEIKKACTDVIGREACYEDLSRMGFQYRHCFQVIQEICYNDRQALARLELPADMEQGDEFVLHPSLMDGALQSVVAWMSGSNKMPPGLSVPFTMGEVQILNPLGRSCYVVSTPGDSDIQKYNVTILNTDGRVAVRIKEHYLRSFQQPEQAALLYFNGDWRPSGAKSPVAAAITEENLLAFVPSTDMMEPLKSRVASMIFVIPGREFRKVEDRVYEINPESPDDYRGLLGDLYSKRGLPDKVLHCWSNLNYQFEEELLNAQLHLGFYSMFYLSRALMELESNGNVSIIYAYGADGDMPQPQYAGIGGMVRSIHRENPRFQFKTVASSHDLFTSPRLLDILLWELTGDTYVGGEVKWDGDRRFVREYRELSKEELERPGDGVCFKPNGVYLITGGAGELGLIIAGYLAREFNARLVLCGRSDLSEEKQRKIEQLKDLGADVKYFRANIARRQDVKELIAAARSHFGGIDGVVHSAGAIRDSLVMNKKQEEIDAVINPKVFGAMLLDEETKEERLDVFMIFSSISSRIGYLGQLDYAYANRYLDEFADMRRILQKRGERSGKTISINWPYWLGGGMQMDDATITLHRKTMGLWGLETDEGLAAFRRIIEGSSGRMMVIKGDRQKIAGLLEESTAQDTGVTVEAASSNEKLHQDLQQIIFDILKIPRDHIQMDKELSHFGFDSLTFTDFANTINEGFQIDISPAVFYEYRTLKAFSAYLETEFADSISRKYASSVIKAPAADTGEWRCYVDEAEEQIPATVEPVAIIGTSAALPGASDVAAFWKNLLERKDCIGEVPEDRWDWRAYFGKPGDGPWRTDVKWGGFVDDVDKFDASFFGISPREAMLMDPQQRLFLETAWKTIEDAGYGPASLGGTDTGVFVGVSINDYNELMKDWDVEPDAFISTGVNNSIIANRVSYLLDLRGPSEMIDTACSSSLVCVRHAIDCIRSGDCGMALVGAVNIMLRPKFHIAFRKTGILSGVGRSKTFDKRADGYVRAEGVAAMLLKPLSKAEADGDHIYAVIKGVAENHGGRAQSLTAPNPGAQADVIVKAYGNAGVSCDTIGYIEAHGTGTQLGDPIEINGLKKAFKRMAGENGDSMRDHAAGYCGLGAVKTNVGHLEAVAGLAGMIKVMLAMNHRLIPASIHQKEQNPLIDLNNSPFYIVSRHTSWEPFKDESGNPLPLRAGVSSFGFGGANAHVVLEEYRPPLGAESPPAPGPYLFVLSAKNEERLKEYALRMKRFLEGGDPIADIQRQLLGAIAGMLNVSAEDIDVSENVFDYGFDPVMFAELKAFVSTNYSIDLSTGDFDDVASVRSIGSYISRQGAGQGVSLPDVAYTLQVGRDPMDERMAIVASTADQLIDCLERYRGMESLSDRVFLGALEEGDKGTGEELERLARSWVSGHVPDWESLYTETRPRRVSLPVYPFARDRHWLPEPASNQVDILHPLVHTDHSNQAKVRFTTRLRGDEFFLKDHVVAGRKILPGVAYFEMARAAGEIATQKQVKSIRNVVWSRPAESGNDPLVMDILLSSGRKGLDFKVATNNRGSSPNVHATGTLLFDNDLGGGSVVERSMDIDSITSRCSRIIEGQEFYRIFGSMGIQCGPGFRPIQQIFCGSGEALANIELPVEVQEDFHRYVLHPTLIDGSLQTIVGLLERQEIESGVPYLPFTVGELRLTGPLPNECYAYVKVKDSSHMSSNGARRFDIRLLDREGRVKAAIDDYVVRFLREDHSLTCFFPRWKPLSLDPQTAAPAGDVLVFGADDKIVKSVCQKLSQECSDSTRLIRVNSADQENFSLYARELIEGGGGVDGVVFVWGSEDGELDMPAVQDCLDHVIKRVFYLEQALLNYNGGRPVKHLYFRCGPNGDSLDSALFNGLTGLARTVHMENDQFTFKVVDYSDSQMLSAGGIQTLADEWVSYETTSVIQARYKDGQRSVRSFEPFPPKHDPNSKAGSSTYPPVLRDGGVYIVTGGAGGLGALTCGFLAKNKNVKLVLAGRSDMTAAIEARIRELESLGAQALYVRADISVEADARSLMQQTKQRFGAIHGIFHCAGLINDALLKDKTPQEIERVLLPKVNGTLILDECTKNEPLDVFVMYSSVSGAMGNTGQSDYAYANSFMDHFATARESLRQNGSRSGHTLSVNWPYWRDGGMRLNQETERFLSTTWGVVPLDNESGLNALAKGLELPYHQFMALKGNRKKIERWIDSQFKGKQTPRKVSEQAPASTGEDSVVADFLEDMMMCFSQLLGIERNKIGLNDTFDKLGLSSIVFVDMANQLNGRYGLEVIPSVFFQFSSPRQVIDYLFSSYKDTIMQYYNRRTNDFSDEGSLAESALVDRRTVAPEFNRGTEAVAIIGMSGRMPQSPDLKTFWNNLISKKDLVSRITGERWDLLGLKDQPFDEPSMIQAEWGGFLDDIEMFDAGFFHISRREAELMDPQQRLFLETVWKTIEDAGYRAGDLSGSRTGVFVGVANTDYFDVIRDSAQTLEAYVTTGNEHSVLANRISFLLNLKGPSEPVNTACSSSLVALANAVDSLRAGRCHMAIAGGVNVISSRGFYITISDAGMLADDGRCKSFDKRANGYVRGEGAGALLLKPLDRAIEDGDHIYALIKGHSVNHGGRVSSLTVPNAAAQADLLEEAFADAAVPPWSVGYIEAHGTGTELGDPIEFEGLKTAFERMYTAEGRRLPTAPRVGIGTVKANVGHLEAAAGIAGVMKVILSLQRKKMPGLVHFQELNPYINIQNTPFYVVKETGEWDVLTGENNEPLPRRAGVSSFGFGGANAHVVLEEYVDEAMPAATAEDFEGSRLFVLSARDEEQLQRYAWSFIEFLDALDADDPAVPIPVLADIAYTSQVGREPMRARLAVIVSRMDELSHKLRDFSDGKTDIENLFSGVAAINDCAPITLEADQVSLPYLAMIACKWIEGADIDWMSLYSNQRRNRVSLPTYPFLRQRHWVAGVSTGSESRAVAQTSSADLYRIEWLEQDLYFGNGDTAQGQRHCVLVFDDDDSRQEIEAAYTFFETGEADVVWVRRGDCFQEVEAGVYTIDPGEGDHYTNLFAALTRNGLQPDRLIHLWCLHDGEADTIDEDSRMSAGIHSVFHITGCLLQMKTVQDVRMVFGYRNPPDGIDPWYAALGGFALTLAQENPRLFLKCAGFSPQSRTFDLSITEVLVQEMECYGGWETEVQYRNHGRLVKRLRRQGPMDKSSGSKLHLKQQGVYLITGGTGGLGAIFARYLADKAGARLVLVGRSDSDEKKEELIDQLNALGAEAVYYQADVSRKEDVDGMVAWVRGRFGELDGVIHGAGALNDSFIIKKSIEGLDSALNPKVLGAVNIDEALDGQDLDFFVLFSSIAAVVGNSGQSDYALANSFMDYFAYRREHAVSINWPLWRHGGMRVDAESQAVFNDQWGILPMPTDAGIQAFEEALSGGHSQVVVVYGSDDTFREKVAAVQCREIDKRDAASTDTRSLRPGAMTYLKGLISQLVKLPVDEIDEETSFGEMGVDSFIINKFNSTAGRIFPRLPKTLLFEYRNLEELLEYFLDHYQEELAEISGVRESAADSIGEDEDKDWRQTAMKKNGEQFLENNDIAIIGVSGRYPGAANVDDFWDNISAGSDCITEIPAERWDPQHYFNPDPEKASEGKIYCKWGGFLDDVDKFDHEFFNISPREAELIDPQERLFLETAWKTVEDAGYTRKRLGGGNSGGNENRVGVFVGLTTNDYPLLAAAEWNKGRVVNPRSYPWSVANRVSFFFDFHGPSIPVDTGCSSSLTAIYLACRSIAGGECSVALAGGVNVYLHPAKYVQMSAMRMLSPKGRCQTFGAGADGFVPGEGVGAVLLRPLAEAEKHGDHIYAVIKGGAINHGGNTNGYTVPNPRAQADLIGDALDSSGIDPRTISYIEAHGTGTSLGDPIEIEGLAKAYRAYSQDTQFCAVGSVKSNIGHLESAAGIAGVTKILMQMKYKTLAPSLHASVTNPNIDFVRSPFYVQTESSEWLNNQGGPLRSAISSFGAGGTNIHLIVEEYREPQRVAEEQTARGRGADRHLVVLSAKKQSQLKRVAQRLMNYLSPSESGGAGAASGGSSQFKTILDNVAAHVAGIVGSQVFDIDKDTDIADFGLDLVEFNRLADVVNDAYGLDMEAESFLSGLSINSLASQIVEKTGGMSPQSPDNSDTFSKDVRDISLADVAYTLQVGREAMEERVGIVASDVSELIRSLGHVCATGGEGLNNVFRGNSRKKKSEFSRSEIKDSIRERNLDELCRMWVAGAEVNWSLLYLSQRPQPKRLSLPTYPFQKNRCWISSGPVESAPAQRPVAVKQPVIRQKPDLEKISVRFLTLLADVLYMKPEAVDETKPFVELGLDSVLGVELVNKVGKEFNVSVRATNLYDHPSVEEFSEFLAGLVGDIPVPATVAAPEEVPEIEAVVSIPTSGRNDDIAIIGMSARLPGADDIWQFWNNMECGVCSVVEIPEERWDKNEHFDPDPEASNKSYCKWGGFLQDIDAFDSLFFSISPAEAAQLEPQQRLFLQEAWRALEHAGYSAKMLDNIKCGVYVGVMSYNEYNPYHLFNSNSILSARIAYFLNLKGPAFSIDTACSSSLVALHLGCKNLLEGDSEMMLVGGVTLYLSEKQYIQMSRSGMLSYAGRCKTFDDAADGFVPAEGVTVVVLKKLENALEDRDYIHGVIKGSNINQDGRTNGITAPSAKSQKDLEVSVYEKSGINPETISYVEAHGTATNLGDPIEMEALAKSFGQFTDKKHYCGIGSVKTNLGHTSAAAGLASLIKVLLSLEHEKIPPSLFYTNPNRHIDFENSPFYVVADLQDWKPQSGAPRRSAVSSFGFSGTNAHVVIEEPPKQSFAAADRPAYIIAMSARSEESLNMKVDDLAKWLDNEGSAFSPGDISYTLLVGRSHFAYRLAFVVTGVDQLRRELNKLRREGSMGSTVMNHMDEGLVKKDSLAIDKGNRLLDDLQRGQAPFGREYSDTLDQLAQLYLEGVPLAWETLFQSHDVRRIPMPAYPFAKKRHWLSSGETVTPTVTVKSDPPVKTEKNLQQKTVAVLNEILAKKREKPGKLVLNAPAAMIPNRGDRQVKSVSITLKKPPDSKPNIGPSNGFKAKVKALVSKVLCLEMSEIADHKRLADLGMDSIIGIELVKELNRDLRLSIKKEALYEYPSVNELAQYLSGLVENEHAETQA